MGIKLAMPTCTYLLQQQFWKRAPKEEAQGSAPSPRRAGEAAAHGRDNKLHESSELGTALEEEPRGLISSGIRSL